jgi:hypothetical protein
MRQNVHDTVIRCRANEALANAAARVAERECMSLSELIRDAIRQRVGHELADA